MKYLQYEGNSLGFLSIWAKFISSLSLCLGDLNILISLKGTKNHISKPRGLMLWPVLICFTIQMSFKISGKRQHVQPVTVKVVGGLKQRTTWSKVERKLSAHPSLSSVSPFGIGLTHNPPTRKHTKPAAPTKKTLSKEPGSCSLSMKLIQIFWKLNTPNSSFPKNTSTPQSERLPPSKGQGVDVPYAKATCQGRASMQAPKMTRPQ